jgi:hypothetical protein
MPFLTKLMHELAVGAVPQRQNLCYNGPDSRRYGMTHQGSGTGHGELRTPAVDPGPPTGGEIDKVRNLLPPLIFTLAPHPFLSHLGGVLRGPWGGCPGDLPHCGK